MIDFDYATETGWMTAEDGSHTPIVGGLAFPRVTGRVATGPVGVRTMLGEWVDLLTHSPTRAEQERQDNAQRRELLEREARRLGLTPERVVAMLKAANAGAATLALHAPLRRRVAHDGTKRTCRGEVLRVSAHGNAAQGACEAAEVIMTGWDVGTKESTALAIVGRRGDSFNVMAVWTFPRPSGAPRGNAKARRRWRRRNLPNTQRRVP